MTVLQKLNLLWLQPASDLEKVFQLVVSIKIVEENHADLSFLINFESSRRISLFFDTKNKLRQMNIKSEESEDWFSERFSKSFF